MKRNKIASARLRNPELEEVKFISSKAPIFCYKSTPSSVIELNIPIMTHTFTPSSFCFSLTSNSNSLFRVFFMFSCIRQLVGARLRI
ncbi:MAG: hypothetical protein IPJ66_10565 [Bacteroidetes bacterium]|nr:hypothetical protein [Bacteroidota bacterium]